MVVVIFKGKCEKALEADILDECLMRKSVGAFKSRLLNFRYESSSLARNVDGTSEYVWSFSESDKMDESRLLRFNRHA